MTPFLRLGELQSVHAVDQLGSLAPPVAAAVVTLELGERIGVVDIDPDLSDTAATEEAYGLEPDDLANCVIVAGTRGGERRIAACVVSSAARADVNGFVRRALDVRKASFLDREDALMLTGMEYGGVSPLGLPADWPVFVQESLVSRDVVVIGSGVRRSKILLPGSVLAELPGAVVTPDVAIDTVAG
jgi:prolyl-tRNA editing enzyme YbaK/EbsC (Cys-tRNA(Pro) deacylase)